MSAWKFHVSPGQFREGWSEGANHYHITLSLFGDSWSGPYSAGLAHTKPPTLKDILGCLVADAGCVDGGQDVEQMMKDLGYDTDSRSACAKAERDYDACHEALDFLQAVFGDGALERMDRSING